MITHKQKQWLKKNYEKTETTRNELLELFNKEFGTDYSIHKLTDILYINRIKKSEAYRKKMLGKPRWVTEEIKCYVIECAKKGMTRSECARACEYKFMMPFSINSVTTIAHKQKINFNYPKEEVLDRIFYRDGIVEMIFNALKECQSEFGTCGFQDVYIRDKIIEIFGRGVSLNQVRYFCSINNIKITSIKKPYQKKERSTSRMDNYEFDDEFLEDDLMA